MSKRKKSGDARPHRIAHNVGAADFEMVEQVRRILGHGRRAVTGRVIELLAQPMPAIVVGNRAVARRGQRVEPMRIAPICRDIGGKAVNEEDRVAAPLIHIGDLHAAGGETLHSLTYRFGPSVTMPAANSSDEADDHPWRKLSCLIS